MPDVGVNLVTLGVDVELSQPVVGVEVSTPVVLSELGGAAVAVEMGGPQVRVEMGGPPGPAGEGVAEHAADLDNPHQVTAVQTGADPAGTAAAAVAAHEAAGDPHPQYLTQAEGDAAYDALGAAAAAVAAHEAEADPHPQYTTAAEAAAAAPVQSVNGQTGTVVLDVAKEVFIGAAPAILTFTESVDFPGNYEMSVALA